ncbi:hypothetical protein JTE90_018282 [Oedothorax gibbosus]|uniref:Hcy-binding domain-containing protein n=1 Tax=Oedothorax gibbosus TaxID=931172 RepID=A0AAV6UWV9_9ARAC|nr:hypothetical protein JTE90_018282 [Oedothorax gibbosus]
MKAVCSQNQNTGIGDTFIRNEHYFFVEVLKKLLDVLLSSLMDASLHSQITILDGGLATELERNGLSLQGDPLWSARVLHENPDAIVEVHKSYLQNGAQVLTTSSYQASFTGFKKHLGLSHEESRKLLKLSIDLAKRARKEYNEETNAGDKNILVAGSIGSYGAALADGSEYNGSYAEDLSHGDFINWHRPRIECLVEAGADLLAFETIPALNEAEALMKILNDMPHVKAWLSFSCQSMHKTSHGDEISAAALNCMKIARSDQLVAVGVNCCQPEFAESLLKDISSVSHGYPLVVYPNSGELWDTTVGWTGTKGQPNHTYLESWIKSGANYIGGCCRTTPEDILEISKYVGQANK